MKKLLLSLLLVASGTAVNAQWTAQATGFAAASRGLSEIRIVDANTVWAVAYDGSGGGADIQEFTRTTNGGTLWTAGNIDVGNPVLSISNISPVSGTTAWVGTYDADNGLGGVFRTTDGGVTWEPQNSTAYTTAGVSWFNFVHFFDANNGVSMGDPEGGEFEVYRTTNGGDTWTRVPGASLPNPLTGEYGYNGGYAYAGGTLWYTTNKGRLYKTTDMGVTWTVAQAPLTDFGSAAQSGQVDFVDANNGFLLKTVGTTYTYYTTTNGGTTWSASAPFTGTRRLISYIPGTTNTLVATSAAAPVGTSLSINNGATWTDLEPGGTTQRGVNAFYSGSVGWAAGFSSTPTSGGVFKLSAPLATTDFAAASKFKIFPNPAYNNVTISASGVDAYKLAVTDISGKVVLEKSLSGIENTLDISSLSSGAYFFTLNSDSGKETVKIIKN